MFEVFKTYITDKIELTDQELDMIRAAGVVKRLRKRQYLLQEGDIDVHKKFILKGCLRQYRMGDDGAEHIMRFAIENWWISDRESYTTGLPSKCYIDAIEESEILMWHKSAWEQLVEDVPALQSFEKNLLARSFNASQNRIHAAISYTAEEKYQNFLNTFPDIFNRVPLLMIASYLGISRETLSRIRKQFVNK